MMVRHRSLQALLLLKKIDEAHRLRSESDGVLEEANTPAQLETSGEVFFTDLDLSDTPEVTAQFTSVEPVAGSGFTLTPEQKVAFTNALTVQQSAGNANNGGATWTFASRSDQG